MPTLLPPRARRPLRPALRVALSLAWLAAIAPAALAALTIAEAAPKNSFLLIGADDVAKAQTAFDRTPLKTLWEDKEFAAWRDKAMGDAFFDPFALLKSAGGDPESLRLPKAAAGLALFVADAGRARSDEFAGPNVEALALADFADDAQGADAALDALTSLAEQGVKDGVATKETIPYEDAEITRVGLDFDALDALIDRRHGLEPRAKKPAARDAAHEEDPDAMDLDDENGRSHLADESLPETVMFTRVGNVVLACSHLPTLKEAIDRAGGRTPGPSAGDNPEFRTALAQHEAGYHAYALAFGKALGEYLAASGPDAAPALADRAMPGSGALADWATRLHEALGLDQVRAISATLRFDAPSGPVDGALAILAPEKRGLLTLIDGPAKPQTPPPFVPADAASTLVHRVNFPAILPLLRTVAATLPAAERDEFEATLEMFSTQFEPALGALGGEITTLKRIEKPYGADSQRSLISVETTDPAKLSGAIATLAPLLRMTPREFQGNQIWESPMGLTIGIGFGRVFVGPPQDVEGAFREAGDPDRAKLAAEPAFQRVMAALGGPGIGFEFVRLRPMLEWSEWMAKNLESLMAPMMEDWPPDERAGAIEDYRSSLPPWEKDPPPADLVARHVGDWGIVTRSTPEGILARWVVLPPG